MAPISRICLLITVVVNLTKVKSTWHTWWWRPLSRGAGRVGRTGPGARDTGSMNSLSTWWRVVQRSPALTLFHLLDFCDFLNSSCSCSYHLRRGPWACMFTGSHPVLSRLLLWKQHSLVAASVAPALLLPLHRREDWSHVSNDGMDHRLHVCRHETCPVCAQPMLHM